MPGNDLLRPPKIIQEDAFGVFSTNPSKRTTGGIAKGIVNNAERVQDESFPAIGEPDNHNISLFSSSLVNKFFHNVRKRLHIDSILSQNLLSTSEPHSVALGHTFCTLSFPQNVYSALFGA